MAVLSSSTSLFRLLHLLLLLFNSFTLVLSLNDEGLGLLAFKNSITEDPLGSMNNWNLSDQNPCSWNGISCKDLRVTSISIPKSNLSGVLPSVLGSLSSLRHLNLRNNNLHGPLPPLLFNALALQSIVLSGNSLSGSIPPQISNLKYLQTLDLSHNSINASLPTSLLQCYRLKTLSLTTNNLTASLPNAFASAFPALERLDLSFNQFTGPIPSDMGNLSTLQGTLDLSHNNFSGFIPSSLGHLPEKLYIDLSYNNLTGKIPQNGAMENRGPTAFIGNPSLCGPPLKTVCPNDAAASSPPTSSYPFIPLNSPPLTSNDNLNNGGGKARGLSKAALAAIIVSDVVGIFFIGFFFSYCYGRMFSHPKDRKGGGVEGVKRARGKRECLCFRKDESETLSENVDHYDLVPLDAQVSFDLDELLKASAFVLGKSGIGIVYKVVLEDGLTLAVRRLGEGGSQRFKEFQTEVEAIGKLRHPNIVSLRAYYWSVDEKLLIYDYIPNGNLTAAIHGKAGILSFTPLPWSVRLRIMKGIAKGLAYLHEFSPKKYVHGDLKPNNILLGPNMEPHISDFGLGRLANIAGGSPTLQSHRMAPEKQVQQRQPQYSTSFEGAMVSPTRNSALCYQAPEVLKVVKPSQKWDVYSYGVILLEMISGRSPMVQVGTAEIDLVGWIQLCIEEKKPLADVLDPFLAREPDKEEEIIAVLKIALACVQTSTEKRPSMRHIADAIDRLNIATS
ncbi:hypothetical protein Syun_022246 [Stephania yunnanensis]|uniref:Protein kinase domain-containing protein n=1 Tax=Stephania yunnanensis TaxID=152371 RepID=A0AAP0NRF0_9MAGN